MDYETFIVLVLRKMNNKDRLNGAFPQQERLSMRADKEFELVFEQWDEYINAMLNDGYFEIDPNGKVWHLTEKGYRKANYR